LDQWSEDIYGTSAGDFIEGTLETIHYLLFLVMVLAIIQVFILIGIGSAAMADFVVMNLKAQNPDDMRPYLKKIDELPHVTFASWISDYLFLGMCTHRFLVDKFVNIYNIYRSIESMGETY
jgi:hypothetical protein